MNTCKKCQSTIPNWIKIDGKWCNLRSRKFCIICSPYKVHNTKDLTTVNYKPSIVEKDGIKQKLCPKCNLYLEINSKNYYIKKDGKIYPYCKKCGCSKTVESQRLLKLKCIEYMGGKCKLCGYNKYFGALHFHHRNPEMKRYGISNGRNYNFEKVKKELDKCILLCSNCHSEIHGGFLKI